MKWEGYNKNLDFWKFVIHFSIAKTWLWQQTDHKGDKHINLFALQILKYRTEEHKAVVLTFLPFHIIAGYVG